MPLVSSEDEEIDVLANVARSQPTATCISISLVDTLNVYFYISFIFTSAGFSLPADVLTFTCLRDNIIAHLFLKHDWREM